ncbi:ABC transporter permease [Macrococcus armenti]|uniref:ABC transporter permease n=1 Tax=Macrococcus armenti TaxID=2875764 RepID=UPI001CC8FEE1|nr:ABC transporter permease [Macrococcus armenti]UBH09348.1 ABC transporter permease [Macrococcus armenti]UBH11645.1 ABC transporter permease [Macrococcus armenti]
MKNIINVIREQIKHVNLIFKLSIYNMKSQYSNHYLGVFWNILQPALQVALYYIVFGLGLRGTHQDVNGIPFITHLISGLFPWLFISQSINAGSNAILGKLNLVTKMKFPSSTLISISFVNALINLLITTSIVFALSLYNQYVPAFHYLWFFYFIVASYALIFGISLIMSTLIILVRDMKNILQNIIRMGFFLTPVFWSVHSANHILVKIVALNPFAYLLGVYRNAFVDNSEVFYGTMYDHLYFWSLSIFLLVLGSKIHFKFRNKLVDYL